MAGIDALEAKHDALDGRLERLEVSMGENLKRIYKKLEMMGNRPSWTTLTIITFLSSLSVGLLVILAKGAI